MAPGDKLQTFPCRTEIEELSGIDKIEKDSEYSEHIVKTDVEELDDTDEIEDIAKTDVVEDKFDDIEDAIEDDSESKDKDSKKKEN